MHQIPSSKSYKTNFWSMFNTCLHYIFKVENFSIKVVLNKKIMSKKYDTGERLCSQRNIFIPQENLNIGG